MASVSGLLVQSLRLLKYAVASAPVPGEEESGDLYLVRPTPRGALLAVVDGAGHGVEAARAAHLAIETLEEHASEGVIPLLHLCHERLSGTRGAVISLASVDGVENTVTWTGVGNIQCVLLRGNLSAHHGDASILLQAGVVGYRLPPLQAMVTPVAPGDLLIFATDGIRGNFVRSFSLDDQPSTIAEFISSNFRKGNDDRLVLVARYLGLIE
jgi:negative regulator of sigma-B (phosphoserine phosphatase)